MRKSEAKFEIIEPVSLKDLVLKAIREAILEGKLSPGARIVESQLSKQMQVAQNVVREALQELEFQGLVVRQPNKGTFVTDLSLEDLKEIYRLRMELEGFAAKLAREAGRPNPEDVRRLEQALDEMQAGAEGDFVQFSRADLRFHEIIWNMSGNRFVERALRIIATPQFAYVLIQRFRYTHLDLPAVVAQHRDILKTLQTADAETCQQYVRDVTADFWRQIEQCVTQPD